MENKIKDIVELIREEATNLKTLNCLDEFMTRNFNTETLYDSDVSDAFHNSSWAYMIFSDDDREDFVEIDIQYDILGETEDPFENYNIKIKNIEVL